VWRRRTLFLPVSAAVLIGLALNVVFILELIKSQRRTSDDYARVVDSNQQIIQFVSELRAIRSSVDTMIAQGRWEEAYDKAIFAQRFFADRGYAGYADEVRQRVAKEADAELGKVGELIKTLKFKEAQDKIHQMKEVAGHLQLADLSASVDRTSGQFAEDCWQSLSAYIEGGGGSARALERFLAEVPGTEYDEQAHYILQKLMHSIRFSQWPFDAQEAQRRQRMTGQVMELSERQTVGLDRGAALELALIPAGEFMMGSASDQPGAGQDSVPQHRVRIADPFYVSTTEITCAQFEAVTGRLPSALTGTNQQGDANLPAPASWQEAEDFCKKLSLRSSMTVRLPTEAEWEYFCRAGSDGAYGSATGAKELGRFAWDTENSEGRAHPVGAKEANVWGLKDLLGNLREWCQDWYDARYYLASPVDSPTGPPSGTYRVLRGGAYAEGPEALQAAVRAAGSPDSVRPTYGFRVCVNVMDDALVGSSNKAVASSSRF
jgi:formylglycine-generating enzyme required for sulfatase activity